jgi:hypothetical protein
MEEINLVKIFNKVKKQPIKEIWIEDENGNLHRMMWAKRKSLKEPHTLIIRKEG